VIQREYDAETPLEDNFISLKLTIEGHKIVFSDPLDGIQEELVRIID